MEKKNPNMRNNQGKTSKDSGVEFVHVSPDGRTTCGSLFRHRPMGSILVGETLTAPSKCVSPQNHGISSAMPCHFYGPSKFHLPIELLNSLLSAPVPSSPLWHPPIPQSIIRVTHRPVLNIRSGTVRLTCIQRNVVLITLCTTCKNLRVRGVLTDCMFLWLVGVQLSPFEPQGYTTLIQTCNYH